ncbi:uncharacterized protein LY79DRAFT_246477 [Colletotrichum navitas]|uniref:Uncharacterized protein n=1 Tax=Colletotrichum navitas TaxID=681940 RepID=A0AAD8QC01_9PEZI|nr:uncharacterized protein LY79DRAFT_246477 [Colletotrichum navitas]KAK1598513.1 hypothetical protein LY79DRAFT_246477 [Colletotrichum navitas]
MSSRCYMVQQGTASKHARKQHPRPLLQGSDCSRGPSNRIMDLCTGSSLFLYVFPPRSGTTPPTTLRVRQSGSWSAWGACATEAKRKPILTLHQDSSSPPPHIRPASPRGFPPSCSH